MPKLRMRFEHGDPEAAGPVIDALLDQYEAWLRARQPGVEVVDVSDLQSLLEWKLNYGDGALDVWSQGDVEEFLLGFYPRKVSIPPDMVAEVPEAVAQAFTFLGERRLLSTQGQSAARLASVARSLAEEFTSRMADPANFGMAKSIFASVGANPSDTLSPEALDELMASFNALPFEQRVAATDAALSGRPGVDEDGPEDWDLPTIGPVVLPADAEVRASAAAAPVLAGFRALAEFFAPPGRPLTQRGNIRLADAQAISGLLGTDERLEQQYGDRTFHRRSSTEMPVLDHWQWWARESGAVRVRSGRMVAVQAWRRRCASDPVGEALRAVEVLRDHGPIASYRPWMVSRVHRVVDAMLDPFLALLLSSPAPMEFTTLLEAVEEARRAAGSPLLLGDPEIEGVEIARATDDLLTLLERAGMVTQHDATWEPTRFWNRRTGGTVALTPFGVVAAVNLVRDAGLTVVTVDDPSAMVAADLARLAAEEELVPEQWVDLLVRWLAHQPDRQAALGHLLDALVAAGAILALVLVPVADEFREDLATVLSQVIESHGPDEPLGAVARLWLLGNGRDDLAGLEETSTAHFTILGMIAVRDPEEAAEAFSRGLRREEQLGLLAEISRRMPPNVDVLLQAIGREHPDKVVAKAARKELMRVRSRMAAPRVRRK